MTSISNIMPLEPSELADYGQARVRDIAFDAIRELWLLRQAQGMKQVELAAKLGRDPAWVSRNLRGPRNWTFKTFGALLVALGGDLEMVAHPEEAQCPEPRNYHAYADFPRSEGANTVIAKVGTPTPATRTSSANRSRFVGA